MIYKTIGSLEQFGPLLASARKRRRYSQLKLSELANVSTRHISFIETGRARPSQRMVRRLATALGLGRVEASELMQAAGFVSLEIAMTGRHHFGSFSAANMDMLYAIEDAAEAKTAISIGAAALEGIGLSHFFLGTMSVRSTSLGNSIRHHDLTHAPVGWLAHYRQQNFGTIDPLLIATVRQQTPFFWSEVLTPRVLANPSVNRMLGEAAEFGISSGYVASIRRPDGKIHAISCMAKFAEPNDPRSRATARAVSTAILHKAEEHEMPKHSTAPRLDVTLHSIVKYLLDGVGAKATAQRLRLSEAEFACEISHLCRLFGTNDPLNAALRARRYGLVNV